MSDDTNTGTSLREDLAAAMQEIEERESAVASEAPAAAPDSDDAPAAAEVVAETRTDGRDEKGRFAPKAKPEGEGDPAAAAAPEATPADAGQAEADTGAPSAWREGAKAVWASIPAEARAEIHRRERHVAEIAGRMDGERRFGREFAEIMRPHMETIQRFGVTPQFAVQTLLNNDRVLRSGTPEQKLAMARGLIADYGIDLGALMQPDPNFPQDPHVRNLQAQIAHLQRQLQAPQQAQQFAPLPEPPVDAIQAEIEAFKADPAHPHFDQVMPTMLALIDSGAASDLQNAYDQAVWASPTLRSTLQGQTPPVAQRQAAPSHNAAARRAAVSVSGSPGAAGTSKPGSLREELREQLRQHGIE